MSLINKIKPWWKSMTGQYIPEKTQGLNATAYFNGDFYELLTSSGRGLLMLDPYAPRHYLLPNATDCELGECLLDALSRSKIWTSKFIQDYLNTKKHELIGDIHVNEVLQRFNYKTKKDYFKRLSQCSIRHVNDYIEISPSHHYRLDSFRREKGDGIEDVIIPANSTPSEVGAALRLAFSRCISSVR